MAIVVYTSIGVALAADGHEAETARVGHVREFLSRLSKTTPTVAIRNSGGVVDVDVQGAFAVPTAGGDPGSRACAFLEDSSVAREIGFPGHCRVRDVDASDPRGPIVVRLNFYEEDVRIGAAEAIVHLSGDQITYIGGAYPLRSAQAAREGAASLISVERARSIALDRLYAHGWTPENKWVRRYKDRIGDPNPFDPLKDIKVAFLIPEKGPSLVYEVNTTCAGYLFWVDAHSGEIVHEELPFVPDVVVP